MGRFFSTASMFEGFQASASAPQASWPLTGMGVEANWSFAGSGFSWAGSTVYALVPELTDIASLTGAAKVSFDAAVSDSTACSVTITITNFNSGGNIQIRMKGGSWVQFDVGDNGEFVMPVTSGAGSGFDIRGTDGSGDFEISTIEIELA